MLIHAFNITYTDLLSQHRLSTNIKQLRTCNGATKQECSRKYAVHALVLHECKTTLV